MKRRMFLGLGATSIGVGTLYGTGALSSVSAGRGISLNAADDSGALVELDIAPSVTPDPSDNELLFTVRNNFESELTVNAELTDPEDGYDTISLDNSTVTVSPDDPDGESVFVNFSNASPDATEISFKITANTDSATVTLNRGGVRVENNSGGGNGNDDPPDAPPGEQFEVWGGSASGGRLSIDLRNDGGSATLTGATVDNTKTDAETVNNDAEAELNVTVDGGTRGTTNLQGNGKGGRWDIEETLSIDDPASIANEEIATVVIEEFRQKNGNQVSIEYETIDLTFTYQQGGTEYSSSYSVTFGSSSSNDGEGDYVVVEEGSDLEGVDAETRAVLNENAYVSGDVDSEGDVVMNDGSSTDGEIDAAADVSAGDSVYAADGISSDEGSVTLGNGGSTDGDIDGNGGVSAGDNVYAADGISSDEGSVTLGNGGSTDGDIDANGDVSAGDNTYVADGITSDTGNVTLGDNSSTNGDIDAAGDVTIGADSSINGAIDAGGDVFLGENTWVEDDIDAGGDVTLSDDVGIGGDVSAAGSVYWL